MKKAIALCCTLLSVTLLISGCSAGNSPSQAANHPHQAASHQKAKSGSSSANLEQSSSSAGTLSQATTENSGSATDVLSAVQEALQGTPNLRLPSAVPVASGFYLSAQTQTTSDGYVVIFKQTNQPITLNDASLASAHTIASFRAKTYADEADAAKQMNYYRYDSSDGRAIDLGSEITGYADAGAGTAGISWNEGRWMLEVLSPTADSDRGETLAKNVVRFLQQQSLPAPHTYGSIQMYTDSRQDTLSWQDGQTIYSVTDTTSPFTMLTVAASTK
ncbi:MAG: hypothetical protein ABF868_03055 [Sporolactobacillus sp.]